MPLQFSRKTSIFLNGLINNWLPPALRDAAWFMRPLMGLLLGKKTHLFLEFRERAYQLSDSQYQDLYQQTANSNLIRGTDLNAECLGRIPDELVGSTVLEAGCGRGILAKEMAKTRLVTALDVVPRPELAAHGISFVQGNVENLPFPDASFDSVVCTHVLEHVLNLHRALGELCRVARQKVILVVPCERPYRFGFNLHCHFFPYRFSLEQVLLEHVREPLIELAGGDWFVSFPVSAGPLPGPAEQAGHVPL